MTLPLLSSRLPKTLVASEPPQPFQLLSFPAQTASFFAPPPDQGSVHEEMPGGQFLLHRWLLSVTLVSGRGNVSSASVWVGRLLIVTPQSHKPSNVAGWRRCLPFRILKGTLWPRGWGPHPGCLCINLLALPVLPPPAASSILSWSWLQLLSTWLASRPTWRSWSSRWCWAG